MHKFKHWGLLGVAMALAVPAMGVAQTRLTVEARGGANVPTFDIADVAKPGPSFGGGIGVEMTRRVSIMADADFGFHKGADLIAGTAAPDVNVYHFIAKVGYKVYQSRDGRFSFALNAGAGAVTFDVDGASMKTYPAINAGAKFGYLVAPRVELLLSPQGDIAFSKEAELGTANAWVWPFSMGLRFRF